jgi:hypothetical protein
MSRPTRTFAERMDMPERLWRLVCSVCGLPFPLHPRPDHAFSLPPVGVVVVRKKGRGA